MKLTALRASLEQQEQEQEPEPVAWMREGWGPDCGPYVEFCRHDEMGWRDRNGWTPLYTHPPRREWRGLKEWEINDGLDQLPTEDVCSWSFRKGVYFAEDALKEKNHG